MFRKCFTIWDKHLKPDFISGFFYMIEIPTNTRIIFYDGECRLCNGIVKFVLKRDRKKIFKFARVQGDFAKQVLDAEQTSTSDWNSFILLQGGKIHMKSRAALLLFTQLGWEWKWFYLGWLIPGYFRDALYDYIANHRYRWFGKEQSCLLPGKEWNERFID